MKTQSRFFHLTVLIAAAVFSCLLGPTSAHSQGTTSLGTDFWFAFMPDWTNPCENIRLFVGSGTDNTVHVDFYGGTNPPAESHSFDMIANSVHTLYKYNTANAEERVTETPEYKACHVTSKNPICLYGFENVTATSDGFLALPTTALGTDYYVACYYDDTYGGPPWLAGEFVVVAPYDNTFVTITTRCDTRTDPSGATVAHQSGDTWTVTLMRGQTYLVQSTGLQIGDGDLTGSHVTSNKPIGVLSGHQRCTIPIGGYDGSGVNPVNSKDLLVEMIPSVDKWGTSYYDMPMAHRSVCGDYIRLIAGEPGCIISANGNIVAQLDNPGDWTEIGEVLNSTVFKSENGKRFLAVQYSYSQNYLGDPADADPFMIVLTPQEQFQKRIIFRTPNNLTAQPDFVHYATFICRNDSIRRITLNGQKLGAFGAVYSTFANTNPVMAAARIQLSTSNTTFIAQSGEPFGLYLYGFTNVDGYGWPAGMAMKVFSTDTLPPLQQSSSSCGDWNVTLYETRHMPTFSFEDTRISDIALITDVGDARWPRPSVNYKYIPDPNFTIGDSVAHVQLAVLDKTKDAYAALWTTDKAGNDTVYEFTWIAPRIGQRPNENPYSFKPVLLGTDSCRTLTFFNRQASGDLTFPSAWIEGTAKGGTFHVTPTTIGKTLHPGDSLAVTVCFNPTDSGASYDTLMVGTTCVPFPYPLLGFGATPLIDAEDLNFGVVDSGETKCKQLKITNRGTWELIVSAEDLKSTDPNFAIDTNQAFPIKLAPGESALVWFCFTATDKGKFATTLHWSTNVPPKYAHQIKDSSTLRALVVRPGAKLSLFEQDYRQVRCGEKLIVTDTLYNDQSKSELIDSVRIHGTGAKWYALLGSVPTTNFVLDTRDMGQLGFVYSVQFDPDADPLALDSTTRFAQLIAFTTNAKTHVIDSTIITNLFGKRIAPVLVLDQSGQSIDMGVARVGFPLVRQMTIRDTGNDLLVISGFLVSGTNSNDFTLSPAPPYTLNPGDTLVVTVRFRSVIAGEADATFTTVTPNCTPNQSAKFTAIAAATSNTAQGADYPIMWSCQTKTLTNAGYYNLSTPNSGLDDYIDSVVIVGDPADFKIDTPSKYQGVPVDAGDSLKVSVEFTPTSDGAKTGVIRFYYKTLDTNGNPVIGTLDRPLRGTSESLRRIVGVGSTSTPVVYTMIAEQALQIPIQLDLPFVGTRASLWGYGFTLSWKRDIFKFNRLSIGGSDLAPSGPPSFDPVTGLESRQFTYSGTKLSGENVLGQLTLETRLDSAQSTGITISNLSFLDSTGAPVCYVVPQVVNATFNLDDRCGYKTIRSALSGNGIPLRIIGVHPNPSSSVSEVNFELGVEMANVTVSLFDALGHEVVRAMDNLGLSGGEYQVVFNASQLTSGLYYCRISDGKHTSTKPVLIQR